MVWLQGRPAIRYCNQPEHRHTLSALAAGGQYVPGHDMAGGSAMPALKYGMNLHLQNGQPPLPADAEFRVLTTCSWEQNEESCKVSREDVP